VSFETGEIYGWGYERGCVYKCVAVGAGLWFVLKGEEVTRSCRRYRDKSFMGSTFQQTVSEVLKSRRTRWGGGKKNTQNFDGDT
jgi:hypothetical protein